MPWAWWAFACCLAASCSAPIPAELARLQEVTPAEIEVGEEIVVQGSGFVVGPAALELEGTLSAPGLPAPGTRTRLEIAVVATSPSRATGHLRRRHLPSGAGAHVTFSGRATLRFPSRVGPDAPAVIATRDQIWLDFYDHPSPSGQSAPDTLAAGQTFAREIGVEVRGRPEGRGLTITRLRAGAEGARAGLKPGETILAAGAVTVETVADLAPPPGVDRVQLGVRGRDGGFRWVACRLREPVEGPGADVTAAAAIALGAGLFLLFAAGPFAGLTRWLAQPSSGRPRSVGSLASFWPAGPRENALVSLTGFTLFALSPFLVMALGRTDVVVWGGVLVVVSMASAVQGARSWRRLTAAGHGMLRSLPLILVLALAALRTTSMQVDAMVEAQGILPWQWGALAEPASLLLLLATCLSTCNDETGRWLPWNALLRGLGGALLTATLLGGWQALGGSILVGQLLFAFKSWVVSGWLLRPTSRPRLPAFLVLALLSWGVSVLCCLLPLSAWLQQALAWSAGALGLFVVMPLLIRWGTIELQGLPVNRRAPRAA